MYMASITDKIELFINELMNNSNSIQIKRNELANLFFYKIYIIYAYFKCY
jgi:transcriptional regulator of stress and heat shock response